MEFRLVLGGLEVEVAAFVCPIFYELVSNLDLVKLYSRAPGSTKILHGIQIATQIPDF